MKKIIVLIFSILFISPVYADLEGDLYQTLADFVQNPKMFFMDIQYDTEDNFPAWEQNSSIQTNALFQLFGIGNLSFKSEVLSEDLAFPQITASINGWYFWGLKLLTQIPALKKAKDINIYGFSPSLTVRKSVNEELSLFAGAKLSVGHIGFDFRDVVREEISSQSLKNLIENSSYQNKTYIIPGCYIGMGILPEANSYLAVQLGYQFIEQRLYAKIIAGWEYWELGLGLYPDSVIILHPMVNFTYKFDI
ncbi:MAG TPA: hypothetical protein DHW82_02735 [Spirochaetia bacterium]|nr:MAG: hypothetical protein A2Y41_10605 [Spirochaetes bacterium GWB1_36_13]HCL55908.1 hypothetical protein [Spirochaetia bacterium]